MKKIFKNEVKITNVGGALEKCYIDFRKDILYLNEKVIPLFIILRFTLEDKERIVRTLLAQTPLVAIKCEYVNKRTEMLKDGKLKIEQVLTSHVLEKRDETQERRERRIENETHRALVNGFRERYKKFLKEYKIPVFTYRKIALELFQESLILEPTGFVIDVDKWMEIYGDYLEAKGSTTFEQHQEVADAINRFFGGAVPITQEELERYFRIENGAVKVNPESVNKKSYLRLGCKGKPKIIKK